MKLSPSFGEGFDGASDIVSLWLTRPSTHPAEQLHAIHAQLEQMGGHDLSAHLPANPLPVSANFEQYPTSRQVFENYAARQAEKTHSTPPVSLKADLKDSADKNTGWKFHLNVAPQDVLGVSEYLEDGGYYSKYMAGPFGGQKPGPGKIFTVYVGSYAMAQESAVQLGKDLSPYLKQPEASDDVEFAPGVVGRFCSKAGGFTAYGPHGLQLDDWAVHTLQKQGVDLAERTDYKQALELQSIDSLLSLHGGYFFDLNSFQSIY